MPAKKSAKATKTTSSRIKAPATKKTAKPESSNLILSPSQNKVRFNKKFVLIILIIGLLLLAYYKKSWFVAATVNGQPITTLELTQQLYKSYKTQTLTQMINEKVLEQEALKNKVTVSQGEVDAKIAQTEAQYGGAQAFDTLLSQQGLTRDDFIKQTRIQVIVEKLYAKEASPTADQIDQFMKDNASAPEATDPAKFKALATQQTTQDNLQKIFSTKFQALKTAAKIQTF